MSIIHIPDDIKKEFKLTAEGVAIVSIRGAERIVGISDTALSKNFKSVGANLLPSELAQMLLNKGFKAANLKNFAKLGIPDLALAVIVEYYAMYAGSNCTDQSKAVLSSFLAIGIRRWVQSELGYSKPQQLKYLTTKDLTETQLEALNLALIVGAKGEDRELILQDVPRIFWDLTMPMIQQLEATLRYPLMQRIGSFWAKFYQEEFDAGRIGKTTFGIRQFELANSSQSMYMASQCDKTRLLIQAFDAEIDRTQLSATNQKQLA